jgi:2-keto-4-pentenoate hydratase/2-oxohepta-3-ene-1,7-dioic acid hydratase in catechol pathway
MRVARAIHEGNVVWGVVRDASLLPLEAAFESTGDLLTHGGPAIDRAAERAGSQATPLADVALLSPVTANQQIVCLGKNYRSHTRETGVDPESKTFNMWFRKASSCLNGPRDPIVRPARVRLLDYEVELGLVIGRGIDEPTRFEGPRLPDVVGALVVHNDVSARDVQVPQLQYYKGKSFRTFGPTGPWLTLVDDEIRSRWHEIRLQTRVNGELRQDGLCSDMVYPPHETLTELSEVQDLRPGDLVATGTPSGVAMQRSPAQNEELARLPKQEKWPSFIDLQEASGRFLKPGDRVELSARTDDGAIDLGTLDNLVEAR